MKVVVIIGLLIAGLMFYALSPKTSDGSVDTNAVAAVMSGSTPTPRVTMAAPEMTGTAAAIRISNDIRESTISANNLFAANANATAVSARATSDFEKVRATQIVEESTAAARDFSIHQTEQAIAADKRSTAESVELTRAAVSTADARTELSMKWTATADSIILSGYMRQTESAGLATATSIANDAASTQAAVIAYSYNVDKARERVELTNKLIAVLPFVIYGVAAFLVVGGAIYIFPVLKTRLSTIARDRRGDAPILFDNRGNFADVDRNPYPITTLGKNPGVPAVIPADLADRTASRDQLVDFTTRGLPGTAGSRTNGKPPSLLTAATAPSRAAFRVYGPDEIPTIPAETVKVLEAEWQEAK